MLFLLLLTFYLGTEATTVTLTEARYSTRYSWPALGRFRISVPCSSSVPMVQLYFYQDGRRAGYLVWDTDENQLRIWCNGGYISNLYQPVDCSAGGNVTYTVQWDTAAQELLVMYGGEVVGDLNGCVDRPDEWKVYQYGPGKITASGSTVTDEGWKLYCNSLGKSSSKLTKFSKNTPFKRLS